MGIQNVVVYFHFNLTKTQGKGHRCLVPAPGAHSRSLKGRDRQQEENGSQQEAGRKLQVGLRNYGLLGQKAPRKKEPGSQPQHIPGERPVSGVHTL